MSQTLKSPSLGRNPSSDYLKRRKSWSLIERERDSLPDVRSFLGTQPYPDQSLQAKQTSCSSVNWRKTFGLILAAIAVGLLAGVILAALAISFHSGFIYSQWLTAKDGTTYYINNMDRLQFLVLLATFFGAAVIVVAAYAVFCLVLSITEGKKRNRMRNIISLRDIRTGDLENGEAHLRTKQSIAKLMSDAEKQYVAEYAQKSPPGTVQRVGHGAVWGSPIGPTSNHIKVQQISDGSGNSVGLVQGRSWSLKRMWSGSSKRTDPGATESPARDRLHGAQDPNEVAARLSSPDAFNRVSSYARLGSAGASSRGTVKAEEDSDPSLPSTPTRGDAIRQRREAEAESLPSTSTTAEPRIMVTLPIEQHGDGSAPSDSEEDFDRERQHSVLPHKAGNQPFTAKVLTANDDDSDFEDEGQAGAWQEVHLESEDELKRHEPQQEGHLLAGVPEQPRQPSGEPKARITFQPDDGRINLENQAVRGTMSVELEEVLPRPQAGLLNRLLRLAKVEWLNVSEHGPVFVIQPGKEYMVGLRLSQKTLPNRRLGARWLRMQPPDGQAVRFNIEEDSRRGQDEWFGQACWDTSLHSSELLAQSSEANSEVIAVHMTISIDYCEGPSYKIEARGVLNVVLKGSPAAARLRASEAGGSDKGSTPKFCLV